MTSGIQSKGVDLDSIFAAYVSGTHPSATGIKVNGTDIATRYQPLPGTAAAATGITTKGADLNTLFSTTATPSTLPINGNTYNANSTSPGVTPFNACSGVILVQVGNGQYNVQTQVQNNGGSPTTTNHPFTIPAGMNYFKLAFAQGSQSGDGSISNSATSWTSIAGTLATYLNASASQSGNLGTSEMDGNVTLYFGSNQSIATQGTFTINASADISA